MHKHINMLITTVCFIIGLYAGDFARNQYLNRGK